MQSVSKRGPHTICIIALWVRCLLEMRLLNLNPDLLVHDLLVRGEGENSLPGATSTVALSMCHKILKTEEIKEEKKTIYILADGNYFWRSWHRLGLWDPGINVCLHVAVFLFWRTWEVGSRQCLLVASWVGGEPLLLGKLLWGLQNPLLALTNSHRSWVLSPIFGERAYDCSDPWSLLVTGHII